ncbi:MAG: metallophosphoesterase family protein [Candidatus Thalassarchaeaceae archaeon]|nr:metallophosphoesterase family protein [Candidatus Thalassarchaeaceae archaeon]MDP6844208.1 metallophosphoesterase family protein [Candidatus Thalassarchaeaceae archaeon]
MRATALLLVLLMLVPLAHAQNLGETLQECPGTMTGSTQPQQIHLQMTDDATIMNVMWATEGRATGEVEWNGQTSPSTDYCYNHDMAFHMASMTGIEPGEDVTYRVSSGGDWSDEFTFTPIDTSADNFEWIAIADHGDSSEGMDVSEAIIADTTAQMVTISGDIAYADGEQSAWDGWFNFQQDSMTRIPWVTAVGNHENEPGYEFAPYEHRFDSDGQAESEIFWYSRDFPGVHMVFMSTEHDYSAGSVQFSWLEQDLSTVDRDVTPFVIVYGHKPMYSSNSYHGSEVELRSALEALYVNHEVDLVIAGHDHFYERTWPVAGETVVNNGKDGRFARGYAPIHLVIGIAGRSAYEELDEPQPGWSAYRENSSYGWTRLVYDGDAREISFTHYRIDGTIGDQFILQEAPLPHESGDGFLGVPGFGTLLPIVAMFGAAVRRLR